MNQEKLLHKIEQLEQENKIFKQEISELKILKNRNKSVFSWCFSKLNIFFGILISALVTTAVLYAAQITFVDGTVISAKDVNDNFTELYNEVNTLKTDVNDLNTTFTGVYRNGDDIVFEGVNVQIVSGSYLTSGSVNGLGNLIVGYNELRGTGDDRSGSHNIVVGSYHNYTSYGGLVVGYHNNITGFYCSVTGGSNNTATSGYSSVSGGYYNTANSNRSSVSGGQYNTASGGYSSVSGGRNHTASGYSSSVSGGYGNEVSGNYSSVSGGSDNNANGASSSVSGGISNTASGDRSSVSGGDHNTASGSRSSVSGGYNRSATGLYDWAAGGLFEDQ